MFIEQDFPELAILKDESTDYELRMRRDRSHKDDFFVTLRIPAGKARAVVTGRNQDSIVYRGVDVGLEENVCEVGAGLSGFLPEHVTVEDAVATPVVIDPLDYDKAGSLLSEAEMRGRNMTHMLHPARRRIQTLLQRCDVFRSDRIQTIPLTLADAVALHPELANSVDVVVDLCATDIYYRTQMDMTGLTSSDEIQARKDEEMTRLRNCLLREGGRVITR